ncbi:MAG: glycosyltransferase [Anaerotruncus sp.]|nr:glycosyltransferase [Anaerotruncus sp.]
MITISLCMIVKNEEDVLARCLDSVQKLADEMIIVDTGSEDATQEIARRYTDQVYQFEWIDDFAAARNFSFSKATKDYILWLDADDILLPDDQKAFQQLKQELDPQTDLVMMRYQVAFDQQGNPTFSYERERLIRREKGYRWVGAIHEAITPSGRLLHSPITITHKKLHPSDPDRNLRIFERLLARGETLEPRQQFYYARELSAHKRYDEAAKQFTRFLNDGQGWIENNISACLDLSECLIQLGQPEQAAQALLRSLVYDRPRAEICCALGGYFLGRQRYQQAIYWYQQARRCTPNAQSGGFVSPDCYGFIPEMQLCVCYDRLGDHETAARYHRKAKRRKPEDASVRHNEQYFRSLGRLTPL